MPSYSKVKTPEVSIIVPIFNVEDLLPRCIDSILAQDFESYEVLLIDDGSTDSSGTIADDYACRNEQVKCYHKANGGLSDARNFGIGLARGRYYAFIDSDDYISEFFVSSLYEAAKNNNADIAVCNYQTVSEGDLKAASATESSFAIKSGNEALRRFFSQQRIIDVVAWNKLYKSELFSQGVRYPVGKINEDVWTTYKLYCLSNRVVYVDDVLYGYYQRDGSIIRTFSAASLEVTEAASDARKWLGSKAIELRSEIDWFELRLFYRTLCRVLDNGALFNFEAEYKRLSQKITLGNLVSNPYGTALEKTLMWLTAHSPALVSAVRSMRNEKK